MIGTPEQLRGELLRDVWQAGPLSVLELFQVSAHLGMTEDQVEADLVTLRVQQLIHLDESTAYRLYGPALDAEDAARREYARLSDSLSCRACGCSDYWPCPAGCFWAFDDLCSRCLEGDGP